nr:hypothetical protein BSM_04290 [uncultured archaeon]
MKTYGLLLMSGVTKNNSLFITRPSDESDNLTVTDIFVYRSLVSLVKVAIQQLLVSQHFVIKSWKFRDVNFINV